MKLKYLPTFLLLVLLCVFFGFYLSKSTSNFVFLRNTCNEIYYFLKGANEEQTTLFEKIRSNFLQTKRRENSLLNNIDIAVKLVSYPIDGNLVLKISDNLSLPDNLMLCYNYRNTSYLFLFQGQKIYYRMLPVLISAFDVEKSIIYFHDTRTMVAQNLFDDVVLWTLNGAFHHYFEVGEFYIPVFGLLVDNETYEREKKVLGERLFTDIIHNILIIDKRNGSIIKTFDFLDIAESNIDKCDLLVIEWLKNRRKEILPNVFVASEDLWHPNDISFCLNYEKGSINSCDLLMSVKALNTVMIFNMINLKIKWFSAGYLQGAHDPDFHNLDGSISIFNNRSSFNSQKPFSSIEKFSLPNKIPMPIAEGELISAISNHTGGHEIIGNNLVWSITTQGRVIISNVNDGMYLGEVILQNGNERILANPPIYAKSIKCDSNLVTKWKTIEIKK